MLLYKHIQTQSQPTLSFVIKILPSLSPPSFLCFNLHYFLFPLQPFWHSLRGHCHSLFSLYPLKLNSIVFPSHLTLTPPPSFPLFSFHYNNNNNFPFLFPCSSQQIKHTKNAREIDERSCWHVPTKEKNPFLLLFSSRRHFPWPCWWHDVVCFLSPILFQLIRWVVIDWYINNLDQTRSQK